MENPMKKIPEQVKRLAVILILIVPLFILARNELIPEDFGKLGHYRASAINEIIDKEIKYAGQNICYECHDDVFEIKQAGFHKDLSCEICHGPAAAHSENPDEFIPTAPRERDSCPLCHEYLPARPTGFPQIVTASHNPVKPCFSCHDAHNPVPPETPKECSACHAEISRAKAMSPHAYVECVTCHVTDAKHKTQPRATLPTKPSDRMFCGQCHSDEVQTAKGIPKIDMNEHEVRYVCWQCHYPHFPEAQ